MPRERRDSVLDRYLLAYTGARTHENELMLLREALHKLMEPLQRDQLPARMDSLIEIFEEIWPGSDYRESERRLAEQ